MVLFRSGVGFYEHAGEIDGDAQTDLRFNVEDINDQADFSVAPTLSQ